ncbi:MAG: hypothetical protein ACR2NX_14580 [Chthoniobacterales bacterium]
MTKDPNVIEATFSVQLPGTLAPSEAPSEIQWAPPGRHTINASQGGKPVKMDVVVDESGANAVAASHAGYQAAAGRGEGDVGYLDFNHDDKEASAHPQSFYWGGDDPLRGGIRAKVVWTGKGRQAVVGRDYSRFSPSFYLSDGGQITGAPVNMGGLVNRAAFTRISLILSKQAEADIVSGHADFLTKAKSIARARNVELGTACEILARESHWDYENYRAQFFGGGHISAGVKPKQSSHANDEFLVRARSLADALDVDIASAVEKLAREQPALYERYNAKIFGRDLDQRSVTATHARAENSDFFILAKSVATARGLDITQAFDIAARQSPALYDAYRNSL